MIWDEKRRQGVIRLNNISPLNEWLGNVELLSHTRLVMKLRGKSYAEYYGSKVYVELYIMMYILYDMWLVLLSNCVYCIFIDILRYNAWRVRRYNAQILLGSSIKSVYSGFKLRSELVYTNTFLVSYTTYVGKLRLSIFMRKSHAQG